MSNLYLSPTFYGIQDVQMNGGKEVRILYPSDENYVFDAPVRDGIYPLVVFAHGWRSGQDGLCPEDVTQDFKRWTSVLHLLARSGLVVAAPDIHREVSSAPAAATALEETAGWMRHHWAGREVLWGPDVFADPDLYRLRTNSSKQREEESLKLLGTGMVPGDVNVGTPTPLGIVGHSWGARAGALTAASRRVRVDAYAAIAGAFDSNEAIAALESIRSSLLVAGAIDAQNASYLPPLWNQMSAPKSQVLIRGADHWNWFSPDSGLHPCHNVDNPDYCSIAWRILSEVLLTFMAKHLMNYWTLPPYLLGAPGGRPPLPFPEMWTNGRCSFKVRWEDPLSEPPSGSHTYGFWTQGW